MGRESHHFSSKDRTFLRAISGPYDLQDELTRLRVVPRVVKGRELKLQDSPQTYNMFFQKHVISKPKVPAPGAAEFMRRQSEDIYNDQD